VAVLVKPPPAPVTVIVYVPVGVELSVDIVSVLVNVGLFEDGLKDAETPEGRPDAERLTCWGDPETKSTVTVAATLPVCCAVPLDGEIEIAKSNGSGVGAGVGVGVCTGKMFPLWVSKPSLEYAPVYATAIVFSSRGMRICGGLRFRVTSELSISVTKSCVISAVTEPVFRDSMLN